jgi:hypothetical protein
LRRRDLDDFQEFVGVLDTICAGGQTQNDALPPAVGGEFLQDWREGEEEERVLL